MTQSPRVLLLGAGPMALDYAKVLQNLKVPVTAVSRREETAKAFTEKTGFPCLSGGADSFLKAGGDSFSHAIIAVSEEQLGQVLLQTLKAGFKKILVEKPGLFHPSEAPTLLSSLGGAQVHIGYNRRFYSSTLEAQKIISADGGVRSFSFEFTEWSHVIEKKVCPIEVKHGWFLHNSSHVIDHAFFLGGSPEKMNCYTAGALDWHPSASRYSGAGKTKTMATFSYQANWAAPGRWGVEIMTERHRLIFRPMEKLQIQKIGSVAIEEVPLEDHLDKEYKPGVYRQTEAFLSETDPSRLLSLQDQIAHLRLYEAIGRGLSFPTTTS